MISSGHRLVQVGEASFSRYVLAKWLFDALEHVVFNRGPIETFGPEECDCLE